jgi:mono/diheme cytochrome c family protein
MFKKKTLAAVLALGGLAALGTSEAAPWDIDMVDAAFLRAYEWVMMDLPEGTVSRDSHIMDGNRYTPEGAALATPYGHTDAQVEKGQEMFRIYCATCHGPDGTGGAPVADNSDGKKRYGAFPFILSGSGSMILGKTDGYLYLTIRNGGAAMPAYSQQMDEDEMWAVVSYIRKLEAK